MKLKILFVLLFVACFVAVINAQAPASPENPNKNSPPYELIFDRFEVFNNTEDMFININLRVKKYNRTTYVLNGQFETKRDFTDDFSVEFRASSESGNEFKVIHTQKAGNACSFLIDNEVVYPELVEFSNLPKIHADMCPMAKGTYAITNYYITDSRLPQKLPSADKWKIDIIVFEKEKVTVAVSIYIIVEHQRPNKPTM